MDFCAFGLDLDFSFFWFWVLALVYGLAVEDGGYGCGCDDAFEAVPFAWGVFDVVGFVESFGVGPAWGSAQADDAAFTCEGGEGCGWVVVVGFSALGCAGVCGEREVG